MFDLPKAFIDRMAEQLGNELPAFLQACDEPYYRGIRFNSLKPTNAIPNGLLDPIPWCNDGFYLSADSNAGAVPLHEAGAWYIQDPSAMIPAAVLDAKPGEIILDLCAAPGGKSTQLGIAMKGQGLLICNEPIAKRASVLSRNIERMGISNAIVTNAYPDQLARKWVHMFDGIQVDAPCSGEGMFRRHPETRTEWTADSPAGCAKRQLQILDSAAIMLRPGGRIVYSTCTLNHTQNEDVVNSFLQSHPDFYLAPFESPSVSAPEGYFTCYPHKFKGEGQFTALLYCKENAYSSENKLNYFRTPDKSIAKIYRQFSENPSPEANHSFGDILCSIPCCPDLQSIKVLRMGLHLGSVRGKLFFPDHAWALSTNVPGFTRVELSDEQAAIYQSGDTISVADNCKGWLLPCLHGLPLGWAKASDGILKNHYPKGLRKPISKSNI